MFEEKEKQTTSLKDLIELVERDSIPTNEFTIEDKDPLVILGKLNEVVAYLESLQATINSSDTKANEALTKAKQAIADATQALSVANGIDAKATQALTNAINAVATANTALNASNTALDTANTAIDTANTALDSSNSAVETANIADTKATNAVNTADSAKNIAEGIDAKATNALTNSNTAINTANIASSTANEAKSIADEALNQVVSGLGTIVYRDSELLTNFDVKPIEENIANNTTAINNEATTRANAVKALDDAKVDKVSGKQLSTEDYTTAEKTKLAGLYNYNDTQVKADITALQTRATNIETKNTEQDTAIANEVTARTNADNNKADRNNPSQDITANDITLQGFSMFNYCADLGNVQIPNRNQTSVYSATITGKTSYSGYALVTTRNTNANGSTKLMIVDVYINANISSLVPKNNNYACTITINGINTADYTTINTFLECSLTQATMAVTNDYMNSHACQGSSISRYTNKLDIGVSVRRAYAESNVQGWINVKVLLTK